MRKIAITRRGGYQEYKVQYLEQIPIKKISNDNRKAFIDKVNEIMLLTSKQNNLLLSFTKLLNTNFGIDKVTKKLQSWHELDFKAFLSELEKARKKVAKDNGQDYKKLSLADQAEWMEYFNEQKEQAQSLQAEINETDKEIDSMVYELYGLTEEEIQIVESGV